MTGVGLDWVMPAVAGLVGGYVAGTVHFRTLRKVTDDLVAGDARTAVLLQITRLAVLAGLLTGAAILGGGMMLVAATGGIMLARARVLKVLKVKP